MLLLKEIPQREASWLLQAVVCHGVAKGVTDELLEALLGHENIDRHWEEGRKTK